jgi:hypothetical protein
MKMRNRAATAKTLGAQSRISMNLNRPTAPKTMGTHIRPTRKPEVARRKRITKSWRLGVCAKVSRPSVDFLAIFVAGVASIVIIINAVFWQSGATNHKLERLFSKLQKTHESLKSEGERLQHTIDSALTRN